MNKQNAVYISNELLFSLKKEENSDTCYYMDEPEDTMLCEINQPQKDKYCDDAYMSYVVNFIGTQSRQMVARVCSERGGGKLVLMVMGFQLGR